MREHSEGRVVKVTRFPVRGLTESARRWLAAGLLACALLAAPQVAHAQDSKQDAKARYLSGQSHYNLNEFQEALQDFKEAYRMYADAAFLFNIAQCERQLGDHEEAIRFYRNYLRNKPQASNRREVEHKIDELKALVEAKKTATQGAPQSVIPPAVDDGPAPASHGPGPSDGARGNEGARVAAPVASPAAVPSSPPASPAVTSPPVSPPPAAAPSAPRPSLALASPPPSVSTSTSTSSSSGVDLSAPASRDGDTPIYQRWWFWAGAAGVVAVGVVAAVALSGGGGASAPSSGLGNQKIF